MVSHGDSQLGGCEFEPEHHMLLGEMKTNLAIVLDNEVAKWIRKKKTKYK